MEGYYYNYNPGAVFQRRLEKLNSYIAVLCAHGGKLRRPTQSIILSATTRTHDPLAVVTTVGTPDSIVTVARNSNVSGRNVKLQGCVHNHVCMC